MQIMQINTVYNTGSTGKIVYDLSKLIEKQGSESYIGYGRGDRKGDNIFKIGDKYDTYMHVAGTRLFDKHGLYSKKATLDFIDMIDNLGVDLFHLHNIHGYYINFPILFDYLESKNKPVIWTLHDCWAFTGHCSHYEYMDCDKWQDKCFDCPQKKQYPKSLFFDNSKNNFLLKKEYFTRLKNLTIVTPSVWLKNEVEKSFLQTHKTICINNGINLDIFKPRQSTFRKRYQLENIFIILGVANVWDERKGFSYFLNLSKKISHDEKIVLVGLSEKQMKGLPSNIIGIMKTENQIQLAEIYSTVDIFVNLTLEETLGLTNIESLACGTPVVTFESGGSPECMDTNTGIVVSKGNLIKLYEAIKIIKEKKKSTFNKYCRKRAKQHFDKDKNFDEYIKLYKELLV
jgi:glycosyltransferase involved in cell wall biosynthesis